ncbi:MAG: hypothetical protein K6G15_07670 [Desulfovibrio sp.]|nr:hypothetical protein [Desulfovibrio sp.]
MPEVDFDGRVIWKILVPIVRSEENELLAYVYLARDFCPGFTPEPDTDIECRLVLFGEICD